jgi:hypothetical protein
LGCTVKELLGRMDSQEFSEWQAYYSVEPFGEHIQDLRFARLCHLEAVAQGVTIENRTPKIGDFMPKYERPKEQTPEEHLFILKMISAKWEKVE